MKKVFKILLILLALLILTLFMPFSFVSTKANDDYEHVMRDSITNPNALVTKIKMLGAHDSFTDGLNMSSKPNTIEGGIVTNKFVNIFAKGLVVRMSKAQNVNASVMLKAGVRYFDVRATKIDDSYYASHGYIGTNILEYVKDIVDFLGSHDGEFIIFDLQHFYTKDGKNYDLEDEEYVDFFNHINTYKNDKGKGILDYAHYNANTDAISTLTYQKVIGAGAGVILLAKVDGLEKVYYRDKDASYKEYRHYYTIRSFWHEENKTKKLLEGIEEEYEFINSHDYSDVLIVNQAQKTGFFTNLKIVKSLCSWSLLDMAKGFNAKMVKDKELFMKYLDVMPIYMADYINSNKGNFNKLANEYIMEANKNL